MRILITTILCMLPSIVFCGPYPWKLVKDTNFAKVYKATITAQSSTPWLKKLSGPSSPASKLTIENQDFLFVHSCKPHYCDEENIVLLYSENTRSVYASLMQNGKLSVFGKPSPAITSELNRLRSEKFGGSSRTNGKD